MENTNDVEALIERLRSAEAEVAALVATAATNMALIQEKARFADEMATSIQKSLTTCTEAEATIKESEVRCATLEGEAENEREQVASIVPEITAWKNQVSELLKNATEDREKLQSLAKVADEKDSRIKQYEQRLREFEELHRSLNEKIESLLPGATSAGLAESFQNRKRTIAKGSYLYLVIFVVSVVGLILLGAQALNSKAVTNLTDFFYFVLQRSPIIFGLVILAEFARRQFSAMIRLEEDYAYKEAVSRAFIGYRDALAEMQDSKGNSLAATLSNNVLSELSQRPGELLKAQHEGPLLPHSDLVENFLKRDDGDKEAALGRVMSVLQSEAIGKVTRNVIAGVLLIAAGLAIGFYIS